VIKFFRRFRQQLLIENKFSKYLLYAIGEIILVVIGILIALSINNWNEARKSSNAEAQALVELLEEFKINYKDLLRVERQKSRAEKNLRNYLDFLNDDSIPKNEKNYAFGGIASNTWNMTYSVLNGLINSGAINNLKNDSLRNLLNSWDGVKQNYMELQNYYHLVTAKEYQDYLRDRIPSNVLLKDSTYKNYGNFSYESEKELEQFAMKFVNDMKYQNILKSAIFRLYIQLNGIQFLKENHNKIVALLEEEIKKK